MQKNVLKQHFENFSISNTKGLDKAYDRFQRIISQLKVHGAPVSNEEANHKFLRALPSAWSNIALIMRNNDKLDTLDLDDLYNNLKVYKADIKGSFGSSSNSQNVAFLSLENASSSDEAFNTANDGSTATGYNLQGQSSTGSKPSSSSSYADEVMFSFFANQSNSPQLDSEDLEQIDTDDMEEIDLKCKDTVGFDNQKWNVSTAIEEDTLLESVEHLRTKGIRVAMVEMVYMAEEDPTDFALMAFTSSNSSFNSEVQSCSAKCLESVEKQLVVYQKNEDVYEEKVGVLEFDVKEKENAIIRLEKYQLSAKDKTSLGYDGQLNENNFNDSKIVENMKGFDCLLTAWVPSLMLLTMIGYCCYDRVLDKRTSSKSVLNRSRKKQQVWFVIVGNNISGILVLLMYKQLLLFGLEQKISAAMEFNAVHIQVYYCCYEVLKNKIYSMVGEDENHDANTPPPVPPTQQAPHTLSTIKLPILKKGKYDIWAMKMEHYLEHTDYPIWEVIQKGNRPVQVSTDINGEDHLAKFHKMTNAKEMWEAIKSRFGGNDESKKMQKYILKQQFESFSVSNSEGLHKGYDRFGFRVFWSQLRLLGRWSPLKMPIKSSLESLSLMLRLLDISLMVENVAFVSSSTSSTNDVSTTYGVSTLLIAIISQKGRLFIHTTDELIVLQEDREEKSYRFDAKEPVALTKPRLSASIATTQGTLLESADQKEIKKAEGKMQGILDIKQKTIGEDLENRMLYLDSPLNNGSGGWIK
ncbi:hypothetical protein Tco_0339840 [Tanacetum coccineum]